MSSYRSTGAKSITISMTKVNRCPWCEGDELYTRYHDTEWGKPNHDDRVHFEFIVLESAQAGLSWITILRKRENYRKAYDNFDPEIVAKYDDNKIEELMNDKGIVRNRRKIDASINNAKCFMDVQSEFGSFDNYIWGFVDGKQIVNSFKDMSELPSKTELSDKISKDLKKRGFKFLGSVIVYSYMQAIGIVDDHLQDCFTRKNI